jgi:uncharacterized protein (TIGR00369 family)
MMPMTSSIHYRKLERMYLAAPINKMFVPKINIERGNAEVSIQIQPEYFHAADAVHGALYFKLLDDAAFFAVNSLVEDVFVLTASFNLYFMRPVSKGDMIATGKVIQESSRLYIAESHLLDSDGREIARGSGTFMKSNIALEPQVGYA